MCARARLPAVSLLTFRVFRLFRHLLVKATTTLHVWVGPPLVQLQSTLVDQHRLDVDKRLIHHELLAYVRFYRDCVNAELLQHVTFGFFVPEVISEANKILLHEFQPLMSNCPFSADRHNSGSRAAHEAEIEDIPGERWDTASLRCSHAMGLSTR